MNHTDQDTNMEVFAFFGWRSDAQPKRAEQSYSVDVKGRPFYYASWYSDVVERARVGGLRQQMCGEERKLPAI